MAYLTTYFAFHIALHSILLNLATFHNIPAKEYLESCTSTHYS